MVGKRFLKKTWQMILHIIWGCKISSRLLHLAPYSRSMHFCVLCRNSRWPQKKQDNNFRKKVPDDSACILRDKNFVLITLTCTVSEINEFLWFMQKFKTAKTGGKTIFGKTWQMTLLIPWAKIFVQIALSYTVSEINAFLSFTQLFKMAIKKGGKNDFGKT